MTKEEAIAFFEDMNECTYGNLEAVEMAISALSTDGEYIKKEDTLKALHDFWDECINYDGSGTEMMLDNESVINSLPTYSFPDREKGEWIYDKGIENWRCSRCGQTPPPTGYVGKADFMATHYNFCPNCGADMRGVSK